jgi:hypothetical protein
MNDPHRIFPKGFSSVCRRVGTMECVDPSFSPTYNSGLNRWHLGLAAVEVSLILVDSIFCRSAQPFIISYY